MKAHNKIILSMLGSAILAGTVSAQNWSVNGVTDPLSLTASSTESAVAIDPLTGFTSIKKAAPVGTPTVSISAAPASLIVNGATTVTWSTSGFTGGLNCIRTSTANLSSWSGTSSSASGSLTVTMPNTAQTVTLTLSCTADNGSATNFTNVSVTSASNPLCTSRPPAVFGSPRALVNKTFSLIWGVDFPGLIGPAFGLGEPGITDGTVLAFEFVAPSGISYSGGWLQAVYSPDSGGRGTLIAGFSECPGEINNSTAGCESSAGKVRNEWTTNNRADSCKLTPGRRYYYNLSTGPCVSGPSPGTPGAVCSFRLESQRYLQ